MNYPTPVNAEEIFTSNKQPIDEHRVAAAIASVIQAARSKGQSLQELQAEVLADHRLLDWDVRCLLRDIVTEAWAALPD